MMMGAPGKTLSLPFNHPLLPNSVILLLILLHCLFSVLMILSQLQSIVSPMLVSNHTGLAESTTIQRPSVTEAKTRIKTSSSFITVNGDGGVHGRRFHHSKRRFAAANVDSSAALLQRSNKEGGHGSVSVSQSSSSYAHPNPFELLSSTDSSLVLTEQASPSTPSNGITPAVSTTINPSSTSRGLAPLPRRTHEQRSASASASALSIRNGGHRHRHPPPHPPSSLPNENQKSVVR